MKAIPLSVVYVGIAFLSTLQGGLHEGMTPFNWTVLGIGATVSGLNAYKAFRDKTTGEQSASDKLAAAGTPSALLPPPTPPPVADPQKP